MTGGDVCEPFVIEQLTRQGTLHNLYGPTEATVLITARQLTPGDSNRSLGAPIANSQVLILDDDLQPVPEHTVGELFIVGPGVCLGYLNNPQQTAERYLNCIAGRPNAARLPQRRHGQVGRARHRAVRTSRQSGEDPWFPGRAGRDRTLPAREPVVSPSGGGDRPSAANSGVPRPAAIETDARAKH